MSITAYQRLRDALAEAGSSVADNGHGRLAAQCPAHDDRNPSLSVTAIEGSALLHCHAGCDPAAVLEALSLTAADLYDTPRGATYDYPGGRRVRRTPAKSFPQSGNKADRSLFHADRIEHAEVVLVVEGEKDVLAAEAAGAAAVCSAMGAGKAHLADWSPLRGKHVVVVPDNDEAGRKHADQVVGLLYDAEAASVRMARAAVGKDLADHIAAGKTVDELVPVNVPDPTEAAIEFRLQALRINREAQRRLEVEENPPPELPAVRSLESLLAEPEDPTRYRIDQVAPLGGKVLLAAQFKAGKTTLVGNLVRALVDDEPFLGAFDVHVPARRVVLIDDELGPNMLRRWLSQQNIDNAAAVADVVSLRGRVAAFNLLDDRNRARWATRLRDLGADYVVLDCLRPVLDAIGLDENRDAGRFLVPFDALLYEAGIDDALVVDHMGHGAERARGDSRKLDWPDAIWRLVRETDEPDSPRYFSAIGRDVDVAEGRLSYDPPTRRITYANGSRTDARLDSARRSVVELLVDAAARGVRPNATTIESELVPPHTQKAIRRAIGLLIRSGLVAVEVGERNAKLHRIAHPCTGCGLPVVSGRDRHETCPDNLEDLGLS